MAFYSAVLSLESDIFTFAGLWSLHGFGAELEILGPNCTLPALFQLSECRVPLFPVSCISLFVRVYWEVINGKVNMCWLTESSLCFLRVLGLVNLFVCCLQTTSGVCLHCKQSAYDKAWKTTSQESPRWQEDQTAVCHHEPPESQTLHTKSC